ncbi:hypothetical protein ACFLQR_04840 [Verrucomicrobiota bacterium]
MPWIVVFVAGLAGVILRIRRRERLPRPWPFLLLWGMGGLALLTLASTKRDIYLIVLLPAFAMMIALMLSEFVTGISATQSFRKLYSSGNDAWRDDRRQVDTMIGRPGGASLPLIAHEAGTRGVGTALRAVRKTRDQAELPPWVRNTLLVWTFASLFILALVSIAPALMPAVLALVPDAAGTVGNILDGWSVANGLGAAALALMAILMTRKKLPFLHRWFAVTALTYIMVLVLLYPVIDRVKNYGPAFQALAHGVVERSDEEVATWNADETTRAGFYYYCNLVFPALSDIKELESVLQGTHHRFTGVIVCLKNFPPSDVSLPPWTVVQRAQMGPGRALEWIRAGEADD